MVEASWADQCGTLHKCSATMENTSRSGARVRLRKPIQVGTKLQVQWRWEQFTGTARYCRHEGKEYVVGIQKDPEQGAAAAPTGGAKATVPGEREMRFDPLPLRRPTIESPREATAHRHHGDGKVAATAAATPPMAVTSSAAFTREDSEISAALSKPPPMSETNRVHQRGTDQAGRTQGISKAVEEKKPMRRKWFGLGHKDEARDDGPGAQYEPPHEPALSVSADDEENRPERPASGEKDGIELLPMGDIYQTAGIRGPRKGYNINKISEMLRSEHLRGLSKEMKRASILVALDAAGISVEEVVEDAKARMEAIDSYEASQRKQFEAHLVRRAEENQQIMAELERVKATYADRLRRNLEGVAREKATFGNWLTLKQQEAGNIGEALELITKATVPEPVGSEVDPGLISSKPV